MSRPCSICVHLKRQEIDSALIKKGISRESFETIAKRFGVTEYWLIRHLDKDVNTSISDVLIEDKLANTNISAPLIYRKPTK